MKGWTTASIVCCIVVSSCAGTAEKTDKVDALAQVDARWVHIEGGRYLMGSEIEPVARPDGKPILEAWDEEAMERMDRRNEMPPHFVSLPSFEMLRNEVTLAEYRACVHAGKCPKPAYGGKCAWLFPDRGEHPMNCVPWRSAEAYCRWLGGRLPSEAEWEYAARGRGKNQLYPWGDTAPESGLTVARDFEGIGTVPVCSTPAGNTADGLCDMGGNVSEWVADIHRDSYDGAPADGSPRMLDDGDDADAPRVIRGGSWIGDRASDFLTTRRYADSPLYRSETIGFRCARSQQ